MPLHALTLAALLAGPAFAAPPPLIPRSSGRLASNISLPGITQTFTDRPQAASTDTSATCTATVSPHSCESCDCIAASNGIQLTGLEASFPADSAACRSLLARHQICLSGSIVDSSPLAANTTNVTLPALSSSPSLASLPALSALPALRTTLALSDLPALSVDNTATSSPTPPSDASVWMDNTWISFEPTSVNGDADGVQNTWVLFRPTQGADAPHWAHNRPKPGDHGWAHHPWENVRPTPDAHEPFWADSPWAHRPTPGSVEPWADNTWVTIRPTPNADAPVGVDNTRVTPEPTQSANVQTVPTETTITRTILSTLSYNLGPADAASLRTVVVTRTTTDILPVETSLSSSSDLSSAALSSVDTPAESTTLAAVGTSSSLSSALSSSTSLLPTPEIVLGPGSNTASTSEPVSSAASSSSAASDNFTPFANVSAPFANTTSSSTILPTFTSATFNTTLSPSTIVEPPSTVAPGIVAPTSAASDTTSSVTLPPQAVSSGALVASSSTVRLTTSSASLSTATVSALSQSASTSSSSCTQTAAPPAPTQAGIVAGCTQWYVAVSGDSCTSIAALYGIPEETFTSYNPAVDPPACPFILEGWAYCIATCNDPLPASDVSTVTSVSRTTFSSVVTSSSQTLSLMSISTSSVTAVVPTVSTPSPSPVATATGIDTYTQFNGDGTEAAGWPAISDWVSFDYMFDANRANMQASCAQWGVPNDSDDEIADMMDAILDIALATGVDARFILAIVMQESTGCVRVITTQYSHFNPGLMQSHNGTGTCNTNNAALGLPGVVYDGTVQTPCPTSEITQMIEDGTAGTSSGDGLQQLLAEQPGTDVSRFYRAARAYNGGSVDPSGDLGKGCCTLCYASDIANRLTGWVNAAHTCTL